MAITRDGQRLVARGGFLVVDEGNSRGRTRDNEPEAQQRREQEAALAGTRRSMGEAEVWDEHQFGDPLPAEYDGFLEGDPVGEFDCAEYGIERTADGKRFRIRRRRRRDRGRPGRDALNNDPALRVLSPEATPQDQMGAIRGLNAYHARFWASRR